MQEEGRKERKDASLVGSSSIDLDVLARDRRISVACNGGMKRTGLMKKRTIFGSRSTGAHRLLVYHAHTAFLFINVKGISRIGMNGGIMRHHQIAVALGGRPESALSRFRNLEFWTVTPRHREAVDKFRQPASSTLLMAPSIHRISLAISIVCGLRRQPQSLRIFSQTISNKLHNALFNLSSYSCGPGNKSDQNR